MINRAGLIAIAPSDKIITMFSAAICSIPIRIRLRCTPRLWIVRWLLINGGAPSPSDILVDEWECASESICGGAGGGVGRW